MNAANCAPSSDQIVNYTGHLRLNILTAVTVFWVVMPWGLVELYRHFRIA
jgi:hypothetical protein